MRTKKENKPKPPKEAPNPPARPANEPAGAAVEQREDDRDDYGGFPDRDLKKNLGCG